MVSFNSNSWMVVLGFGVLVVLHVENRRFIRLEAAPWETAPIGLSVVWTFAFSGHLGRAFFMGFSCPMDGS